MPPLQDSPAGRGKAQINLTALVLRFSPRQNALDEVPDDAPRPDERPVICSFELDGLNRSLAIAGGRKAPQIWAQFPVPSSTSPEMDANTQHQCRSTLD